MLKKLVNNLKLNIMCLEIKYGSTVKTATEDIVCYKFVDNIRVLSDVTLKKLHGETFSAVINEIKCSGKLSVYSSRLFFCTNIPALDGQSCPDKFGYSYSWVLDKSVVDVVTGVSNNPLKFQQAYKTPYQEVRVQIGKTYTSRLRVDHDFNQPGYAEVNIGLHSFANVKDCINRAEMSDTSIIKCIIPKGSKYYEGKFNTEQSYASNKITYVELYK